MYQGGHVGDPAAEQRRIGGFQRHVRPATHRDTDRGRREGRGVIDPVPHHGDGRPGFQGGDRPQLITRQQLASHLDAEGRTNRFGRAAVVAGQHHRPDAKLT